MDHPNGQIVATSPSTPPPAQPLLAAAEDFDFRQLLQNELVNRIRRNPRYSLRKFSQHLDVDHSRLSKILRAERPVSVEMIRHFGERLNLEPKTIESFQEQQRKKPRRSLRKEPAAPTKTFLPIPLDSFEVIEDWRHYAIMELLKLKDFEPDLRYVSRKLRISIPEARAYQERLERVGLLEITPDGRWLDKTDGFSTHVVSPEFTSYAHKRSQKKTLQMAGLALDQVPIQVRDQSSMMMATSAKKLAMAKIMMRKFRQSLCEFLEDCEEKDAVYQLSLSLFPLLDIDAEGALKDEI